MSSNGISNGCIKNGQSNCSVNVLHSKCSPSSGKHDEGGNCNFEDGRRTHGVDNLRNNITPGGSLNGEIIAQKGEYNSSNHKNELVHSQKLQENNFINMKQENAKQNGKLNWGYPFKWNKKQNDPCAEKSGGVFSKMANEYNSNESKMKNGNGNVSPGNTDRFNSTDEEICLNGSGEMDKKKKKKLSISNLLNSNAQNWSDVVNGIECRSLLPNGVEGSHPDEAKKSQGVEKIFSFIDNKHSGKITPTGSGEIDVSIGRSHKKELPQGGRQANRQETAIPFFTSSIRKTEWKSDKYTDHLNGHSSLVSHTQNDGQHPFYMGNGKNCALKKRHENILLSDREEVIYVNNPNGGDLWGERKRGEEFQDEAGKIAGSCERSSTGDDEDEVVINTPNVDSGKINFFRPNGWNGLMSKRARGKNSSPTNCPDAYTNGNLTHSERGYSLSNHKTHQSFTNHVKTHVHDKATIYDMKEEQTFGDSNGRKESNLTGKESLPIYVNPFNAPKHVTKDAPELGRNHVEQNGFLPRNNDVEKTTKKDMTRKDNTAECLSSVHTKWGTSEGTFIANEEDVIVKLEESKKDGMKKDPHDCITNLSYTQSGSRKNGCILNHSFAKEKFDCISLLNGTKRDDSVPAIEGMDMLDDESQTHILGGINWLRCPHEGKEDPLRASKNGSRFNHMNGTSHGGDDNSMFHSTSEGASETNGKSTLKSFPPPSYQRGPPLHAKKEQYQNGEVSKEKTPAEDKAIFNYHAEWMNRLEKGKEKLSNGELYNMGSLYKEDALTNRNGYLEHSQHSNYPLFHPPEKMYPSAVTPNVGREGKLPHLGKEENSHTHTDRRWPKEVMKNGDITGKKKKQIFGYTQMVNPLQMEQTNKQSYAHHGVSSITDPLSCSRVAPKWQCRKTIRTNSMCNQMGAEEMTDKENKKPPQNNSPFLPNGNGPHLQSTVDAKEEYTYGNISKWEEANLNQIDNLSKWISETNNLKGGLNFGNVYSMHGSEQNLKMGEEILNGKMDNQLANGVHPNGHTNNFVLGSYSYRIPHRSEFSDHTPFSGVLLGVTPSICRRGTDQVRTGSLFTVGDDYLSSGPNGSGSDDVRKMCWSSYNQDGRNSHTVNSNESPNLLGGNNPPNGAPSIGSNDQGRDIHSGENVNYLYSSGEKGDSIPKSEIKGGLSLYDDLADVRENVSKDTGVNLDGDTVIHGYADRHKYDYLHGEKDLLGGMLERQDDATFDPNNDYRWKLCHVRYPEHINFKKAFFFTFQNEIYIYGARKNNFIIPDLLFRMRDDEVESVQTRGTAPKLYVKVYFAVEEGDIRSRIGEPRKSFYIWGANEKRELDLYTLYRLDLCRLEWQEIRITYNRNLNLCREDFSLILVKDCLYMYGGVVYNDGEWTCCDELWVCDTGKRKWEMITVKGGIHQEDTTQEKGNLFFSLPSTNMVKHFTNTDKSSSKGSLLEQRKRNESDKSRNAQGEVSPSKSTAKPYEEKQPSRRAGHLCVVHKNRMYIHGGTNLTEEKSDFYFFDFSKNKWFEVVPSGDIVPSGRYGHSGVVIKSKLYIYGGFTKKLNGNSINNDIFEYDFVKNTWRQIFTIGDLIYLKSCLNGKEEQDYLKFVRLLVMRRYYKSATISGFSEVGGTDKALSAVPPGDWIEKGREERLPNGKTKNAAKSALLQEDPHTKLHANFLHIEGTTHTTEAIIPQNIFRNKCLYFNGSLYLLGGCGLDNHFERREENNFFLHYDSVFKMKIGQSYARCIAHYLSHLDTFLWDLIGKEEMALQEWVQREDNAKEDTTTACLHTTQNDFDHLWTQLNGGKEIFMTSGDARPKDAQFAIEKIDHMLRKISTGFPSGGDMREDTSTEAKALPSAVTNCSDKSSETVTLGDSFSLCQGEKMFQLLTWLINLYHSDVCADEMVTDSVRGKCGLSNLLLERGPAVGQESDVSTFNTRGEVESRPGEKKQEEPRPGDDPKEDTHRVKPTPTADGTKEEDLNGVCLRGSNLPSDQFEKRDSSRCSAPVQEASKVDSLEECPCGELPIARRDEHYNNHHNKDGEKEGRRKVKPSNDYLEVHKEDVGSVPPEGNHNPNDQHVCDKDDLRFGGGKRDNHLEEQKELITLGEGEFSKLLGGNTYLIPDYPNSNHIYLNMEKSIIYNYLQQFNDLTDDSYSIKMKIRRNEIYKLIYTYTKSVEIQNRVCFKMLERLEGQARQLLAEREHLTDGGNDENSFDAAKGEQSKKNHHPPFSEDNFESLQNEHGHLKKKMKYFCDMANIYSIKINKLILYNKILEQKYEYVMNCLLKLKSVLFREVVAGDTSKHLSDHFAEHLGEQYANHLGKFFAEDTFFVHEQNANLSTCDYGERAFFSPFERRRNWTPNSDPTK
ncbi:Uncharacterized protein PCOAH_00026520 [Plasmodium coatneyi]|uniref:Kelch domain-containing protein n=1 Tax=Plasmodium coatneyi TaxID=208452 RepID=A0A1B1DZE3_9APIC|nr:Uncharacterized protein PCOAH_00026520 [Plasmodium coatneyi]ANQ08144.1 Uncharacterized protein PCOAH_00026520 [Plasmodium coatneyi]